MATLTQAQLQTLATGIQTAMANLQGRVEARVLAEDIPLVGTGLAAAATQVAPPTVLNSTEDLGVILSNALMTLASTGDKLDTEVQSALTAALGFQGFTGTILGITVAGAEVVMTLATERFGSFSQALADDLGMAGLNISAEGSADVAATFTYDLEFGADGGGFFLDVADGDEVEIALSVGSVSLAPSGTVDGQAYDMGDAGSSFTGTITVNLDDPDRLTAAAVATTGVIAGLTGGADLAIGLELADQGEMTPSLSAVLTVNWDFVNATVTPDGTNAGFGTTPELTFNNVTMDLGGFMENFVAPLVRQVNDLLDPIRPIITVLTASITVLENLPGLSGQFDADDDGRVTLVDVLDLLPNTNLDGLRSLIAVVEQVLGWADFLEGQGFGAGNLILGDFAVTGDIRSLGFDLAGATASFGGIADDLNTVLAGLGGTGWDGVGGGREILQGMVDGDIFSLPILTDPQQWMQLFLGNPVDLVAIDLPTVSLQTPEVPLVPPIPIFPGILFEVLASAGLTMNFDFGFSSRGLVVPGLDALDGFFIVDAAGPEVELSAELILQLSLNAFVANITGGGAVEGIIDLELMNGSESGRLYFDELQAAFATNPFSIFDASGSITLEFFAYVEALGFEVWRWTSPKISLGGFSFDGVNDPVDYNLAERTGGSLRLNTGDRANLRTVENVDDNEQVEVMMDPTGTRTVVLMDFGSYSRRQEFTGVNIIRGDGGNLNDSFVMAEAMTNAVEFSGGIGNDVLAGAAGADSLEGEQDDDALFGGIGNDTLRGGVNDDTLRGGDGADVLDGGGGDDVVTYFGEADGIVIRLDQTVQQAGFALGDQLISIEHIDGTNGNDLIEGSQGAGSFTGHAGNDTLTSGTAVQSLFGNEGNDVLESSGALDTLVGGMGNDTYIVRAVTTVVSENFLGELTAGTGGNDTVQAYSDINLSNNGAWIERIDMFGAARNVTGDSAANRITGTANDDVIDGYIGSDTVFGGDGNDTLQGGLGTNADTLNGGNDDDSLEGGLGNDSLAGGAGDDTLNGGTGTDTLNGSSGNDVYVASALNIITETSLGGTDQVWAQDDIVLATGVAVEILSVRSLTAGAWVAAFTGSNRVADLFAIADTQGVNGSDMGADLTGNGFAQVLMGVGGGSSILAGLGGADTLIGDASRLDTADYSTSAAAVQINLAAGAVNTGGDAAGDVLFNINRIAGSAFGDVLSGEVTGLTGVNDTFNGAGGNDTLLGMSGRDTLSGGAGNDVIEGGFGNDDMNGSNGNDTLRGDAGNDVVLGGEGNDSLLGGDGNDTLDGSVGTDTLDGGLGDDFYIASAGDIVLDSGGFDTVETFVDFAINGSAAIEVLQARVSEASPDIDLTGSSAAQTLIGNNGDNVLAGLAGADTLDGSAGTDEASYAASNAGVTVDLNRTVQTGGHAALDRLISIERIRGSAFNDVLTGKSTFTAGDITANILWGEGGDDILSDTVGRNFLYGGAGNDTLTGSGGVAGVAATGSLLYGGFGNDYLDAGASSTTGGDTLVGGEGNDTIRVTSDDDVVEEQLLGGTDTLIVDVNIWVMDGLQAAIENVTLENNFNLTANALANMITGSALANTIKGEGGNDTLLGLGGGDNLIGGDGNDSLDGGTGGDRMEGGAGNDTYVVDSTGDTVVEAFLAGNDTVRASIDYTIAVGIESLVLTGLGALDGTGNIFANTITGNAAANRLDGGGGTDTLAGGGGNDTYVTDGGDVITEGAFGSGGGTDTVESSATITLSANVENLTLTGTASINGTGNGLANTITGNSAANLLTGGLGSDIFVFSTSFGAVDAITDMAAGADKIHLDNSIFTALALNTLGAGAFRSNTTGLAGDSSDRIIYETDTGRLYFDSDGTGATARVHFASLSTNLAITNADFFVI